MKRLAVALLLCTSLSAQVYSPKLLREGQPDSTDLTAFANTIYAKAHAETPRQKAQAIWRFFLTDGRFVEPGFWYHIAGWTYEEPTGEVLDPIKLINSYGFGLCYHIAPLLAATFRAGGFADARTWFLTGHTVAEVFYEGKYHYYDSDMMGYNVPGEGHFFGKSVASVRDLEQNSDIILGKLRAPNKVKPEVVDEPWYPADLRASAMKDLASLFTTASDNYLYSETRYAPGHSMDFVLRPGEKLVRYFEPEEPGLFYLPYKYDGTQWTEFPQELSEYAIRTKDGPHSQKDARLWATGRIEYSPAGLPDSSVVTVEMPSPYVIIDAHFALHARLAAASLLRVETSTDSGASWLPAAELKGPYEGEWQVEPQVLAKTAHGRLTAVSGSYGYLVRISREGSAQLGPSRFVSRIQVNPRSLPALEAGENPLHFTAMPPLRRVTVAAPLANAPVKDLRLVTEKGQSFLMPATGKPGTVDYALESPGSQLTSFEVGARFLNLKNHLAPDKLTAETRPTAVTTRDGEASVAWAVAPEGPFHTVYQTTAKPQFLDGDPIDRLLQWPEAFQKVQLPAGTTRVYVRILTDGPAIDSIRLAQYVTSAPPLGRLQVKQVWTEGKERREHTELIEAAEKSREFSIHAGTNVKNQSITFSLPDAQ
jgi:hypothetical protein